MSKARMNNSMKEWKDIPWHQLERRVFKLQKRIFKAKQRGDVQAVHRLQKTLIKSWSAKCLSVRRVTQENQGKKTAIKQKAKYVLDADIAQCFDRINHEALLKKLNTFPTLRQQIRAWLKAGVIEGKQWFKTVEGTPQGGTISPLLANVALHGLEYQIKQAFPIRKVTIGGKRQRVATPDVIRYCDDFVILHEDLTVIQRCLSLVCEWLKDMGLELKPSKTRISHTLKQYEDNDPGFDFLGFRVRQFPVGKHQSGRLNGKLLGFKTIITPSQNKQRVHYEKLASIIDAHQSAPQSALIRHLNPVIRGWAKYYSTVVSKEIFSRLDHLMYQKLKTWAKHRHPEKSWEWVSNKYWQTRGGDRWVFALKTTRLSTEQLLKHKQTSIVRHVKVKGEISPYNGNLIYWSSRRGKHPEAPKRLSALLKRQKGKCALCGLFFREEDLLEIDHIIPKSKRGLDEYQNLQLLHRHCHDVKTANENDSEVEGYA